MDDPPSVVSKNGKMIRLPDERWAHIMEEHGELENLRDEVLRTIHVPERVFQGQEGELLAIREIEPGKYLVVIYREQEDGFIITAFLTRRMRWIEKRVQVWP